MILTRTFIAICDKWTIESFSTIELTEKKYGIYLMKDSVMSSLGEPR